MWWTPPEPASGFRIPSPRRCVLVEIGFYFVPPLVFGIHATVDGVRDTLLLPAAGGAVAETESCRDLCSPSSGVCTDPINVEASREYVYKSKKVE